MEHDLKSFMAEKITTVRQLVIALGGSTSVGEMMDVVPTAVMNWSAEDRIPRGYHLLFLIEIWSRGLNVDPAIFGCGPEYTRLIGCILRSGRRPALTTVAV